MRSFPSTGLSVPSRKMAENGSLDWVLGSSGRTRAIPPESQASGVGVSTNPAVPFASLCSLSDASGVPALSRPSFIHVTSFIAASPPTLDSNLSQGRCLSHIGTEGPPPPCSTIVALHPSKNLSSELFPSGGARSQGGMERLRQLFDRITPTRRLAQWSPLINVTTGSGQTPPNKF